jgi:hypothetical protein
MGGSEGPPAPCLCFMWREPPPHSHLSPQAQYFPTWGLLSASMVQKYQSPVRVYKYPFELVMLVSEP